MYLFISENLQSSWLKEIIWKKITRTSFYRKIIHNKCDRDYFESSHRFYDFSEACPPTFHRVLLLGYSHEALRSRMRRLLLTASASIASHMYKPSAHTHIGIQGPQAACFQSYSRVLRDCSVVSTGWCQAGIGAVAGVRPWLISRLTLLLMPARLLHWPSASTHDR